MPKIAMSRIGTIGNIKQAKKYFIFFTIALNAAVMFDCSKIYAMVYINSLYYCFY